MPVATLDASRLFTTRTCPWLQTHSPPPLPAVALLLSRLALVSVSGPLARIAPPDGALLLIIWLLLISTGPLTLSAPPPTVARLPRTTLFTIFTAPLELMAA